MLTTGEYAQVMRYLNGEPLSPKVAKVLKHYQEWYTFLYLDKIKTP